MPYYVRVISIQTQRTYIVHLTTWGKKGSLQGETTSLLPEEMTLTKLCKGWEKMLKKKDMNMSASFNIAYTMMIWWQILLGGVDAEQTIRPDLLLHTKAMIQVWAIMTFENVAQGFSPPKSLLTRHYWRSLSGPRKWHQKSIFQQAANHL